jgi:hypothetical protein
VAPVCATPSTLPVAQGVSRNRSGVLSVAPEPWFCPGKAWRNSYRFFSDPRCFPPFGSACSFGAVAVVGTVSVRLPSLLIGRFAALGLLAAPVVLAAPAGAFSLINGGFEDPDVAFGNAAGTGPANGYPTATVPDSRVPGWTTNDPTGRIEIWKQNIYSSALVRNTPPAYEGAQYAELNASDNSTLFQDVTGLSAGLLVGYQLAHRGRDGLDTMNLMITDLGADNVAGGAGANADVQLFTKNFTTGPTAWAFHIEPNIATTLGNTIRFAYTAVSSSSGCTIPESCGNLIDAVAFGVNVGVVPAPLPVLGGGVAFGFSRRLRKRLRASKATQ